METSGPGAKRRDPKSRAEGRFFRRSEAGEEKVVLREPLLEKSNVAPAPLAQPYRRVRVSGRSGRRTRVSGRPVPPRPPLRPPRTAEPASQPAPPRQPRDPAPPASLPSSGRVRGFAGSRVRGVAGSCPLRRDVPRHHLVVEQ